MIRAPLASLAAGRRKLPRDVSRYFCRVLRLDEGARVVLFDPQAHTEADAVIDEASSDAAVVTIGAVRRAAVVADAELVLVQGLAKGEKIDQIVRDATELGATRIVLARTARSVVKIGEGLAPVKLERWRRVAEQAARQCGRADPPSIDDVADYTEALEIARRLDAGFCLDPRAAEPLGARLPAVAKSGASIAFVVGPEGGLTDVEVAAADNRGLAPVAMGPFTLRTETVAAAALGAVRILRGAT